MTETELKNQFTFDHLLRHHSRASQDLEAAQSVYDTLTNEVKENGLLSYKEFCNSFVGKCYALNTSLAYPSEYVKILGYQKSKTCMILSVKLDSVSITSKELNEDFFNDYREISETDFKVQLAIQFNNFMAR